MCGIAFISELNENTARLVPWLASGIRLRGGDSWGMTNGLQTFRSLGPITRGLARQPVPFPDPSWYKRPLLIHTRAASVGVVSMENCHPFDISGKARRVIGIHNGGIINHGELNQKHTRTYDCDSPHVFHHIADGLETNDVNLRGTIAWLEDESPLIHLCKTVGGDLEIIRLTTGEIVGASTKATLALAMESADLEIGTTYEQLAPETQYTVDLGAPPNAPPGWHLYKRDPMPFGVAYSYNTTYYPSQRTETGGSGTATTNPRHGQKHNSGGHGTKGTSGALGYTSRDTRSSTRGGFSFLSSDVLVKGFTECCYCGDELNPATPEVFCAACFAREVERHCKELRGNSGGDVALVVSGGGGKHTGSPINTDPLPPLAASSEMKLLEGAAAAMGVTLK